MILLTPRYSITPMKTPHLHGFLTGLLTSGCIVFLISASPHTSNIVSVADWPESARQALQIDKGERFRKTSSVQMDLFESVDRERDPITVVFRRDQPSPLVVFRPDYVRIHDSGGTSISAGTVDSPHVIDRLSYSTKRQETRTYYTDQNMDGIIDVVTTYRSDHEYTVRLHIGDEWYESTGERYFEGEWFTRWGEKRVTDALIAKKVETKHYTRAITPTGLKIVKFTGGVPSFVDAVE